MTSLLRKILVIDYDPSTLAFYRSIFSRIPEFELSVAGNAAVVQEMLGTDTELNFDLIAFSMDFLNDNDAAVLLQQFFRGLQTAEFVPVILADQVNPEHEVLLKELCISHRLPKRTDAKQVVQTIKTLLAQREEMEPFLRQIRNFERAARDQNLAVAEAIFSDPTFASRVSQESKYYYCLGEIAILRGDSKAAAQLMTEFVRSHPKAEAPVAFRCLTVLGKALCSQGKFEQALFVFWQLAAKSPANLRHRVFCGEANLGKGDLVQARRDFGDVLQRDPFNRDALLGLAKVQLSAGQTDDAFRFLRKIRGSVESPSLAGFFNNAGIAMVHQGRFREALAFLREASGFLVSLKGVVLFNIGMTELRLHNVDAACDSFDEALKSPSASLLKNKKVLIEYQMYGKDYLNQRYCEKSEI